MIEREKLMAFPWKALAVPSLVLAVALLLAVVAWTGKCMLDNRVSRLQDAIEAQTMLKPYVESIRSRQVRIRELTGEHRVYARPVYVTEMLRMLQDMTADAGIAGIRFVPDALSVVGRQTIRMVGRGEGSTENFRRLIIALSAQPWVKSIDTVTVTAGESANAFEISLHALYGRAEETPGGTK